MTTTAVLFTLGQQLIGLSLGQSSMASGCGAAGSLMEHRGTTFDPHVFAEQGRPTQSGDTGNRLDVTQPTSANTRVPGDYRSSPASSFFHTPSMMATNGGTNKMSHAHRPPCARVAIQHRMEDI
jgi:hypothetical protein